MAKVKRDEENLKPKTFPLNIGMHIWCILYESKITGCYNLCAANWINECN